MMKAAAIAALCIPVFSATAADYAADLQKAQNQAGTWCEQFTQVEQDLQAMGITLPAPSADYCHADNEVTDETKIMSELGMMFDTKNSRVIYLGNVQLLDRRIKIQAREQLQMHLPGLSDGDKEDTSTPPSPENIQQAISTPAPSVPAAEEEEVAPEPEPNLQPASIQADRAIADTINNTILINSPSEEGKILLHYGKNQVQIFSAPGAAAPRVLADAQGNILMEGAQIKLCMLNKDETLTELNTQGGYIYYHASTGTVYTTGKCQLTHPDGSLSCTEQLCVVLNQAEAPTPAKKNSFMSQFTGMKFEGIATATAKGNVVAIRKAGNAQPATEAQGDELLYHGESGECSLLGKQCRLAYGEYVIHADEGIHLLPNGDIELRGQDIHGNYTRTGSQKGAATLTGKFKANANVIFRADIGTITTEKGISLRDEEFDFNCEGPVHLVLNRKPNAKPEAPKPGMPNLVITQYSDVSRARATGHVVAHRYDPATGARVSELKAEIAETDLTTGETLLTGAVGEPLVALHNGNMVEAIPAEGQAATIEMAANGDLKLNGERISAQLLSEQGTTTAKCRGYVRLIRAENRLETGSATELHSNEVLLTTNGPLFARLTPSGESTTDNKSKFPSLRFNYTGIEEARTESGCTVQTGQGSMQCTGPVLLVMNNESKGTDRMLGALKYATARGKVAVAGRDANGRLIRATGDKLKVDAATGIKTLSGKEVTLADANNTHVASGEGASIRIDARNNATISGARHSTHATNIRQQLDNEKNQKKKK